MSMWVSSCFEYRNEAYRLFSRFTRQLQLLYNSANLLLAYRKITPHWYNYNVKYIKRKRTWTGTIYGLARSFKMFFS